MSMQEKTVIITGAGRGLGAAFALALAPLGCRLILCARQEASLAPVTAAVMARGGRKPEMVALDLADPESIRSATAVISSVTDRVDVLINNGAMWLESRETPYGEAEVLNVINAAVSGTFLLVQALRPLMEASEGPDVLTIGSVSGLANAALQSVSVPFYAAKRGQIALAEGLRQEYRGSRFRSLLINPPYLEDAMPGESSWEDSGARAKGAGATSRDVVEAALYALSRPRHLSLTMDLDADAGGIFGR